MSCVMRMREKGGVGQSRVPNRLWASVLSAKDGGGMRSVFLLSARRDGWCDDRIVPGAHRTASSAEPVGSFNWLVTSAIQTGLQARAAVPRAFRGWRA